MTRVENVHSIEPCKKIYEGISSLILLMILVSCSHKDPRLPVVITKEITQVMQTSAIVQGEVTSDGGSEIISRGICWYTSDNPTVTNNRSVESGTLGSFTSRLTKLTPGTVYYVRAYVASRLGLNYGNQITFNTSPADSDLPYFALPPKGLTLMAGQQVTIYGDALINIPIHNSLEVSYSCDVGVRSGNDFVINSVSGVTGDHSITMTFKNNGLLLAIKTMTLTVLPKANGSTKKILLIGDSTMPPDSYGAVIDSILNNSVFTFLGTVGTKYKNEAYGGASWGSFVGGTSGKFCKSGTLNIPAYFADNSIGTPDYIYIRLGINDTFNQSAITGDGLTRSETESILYSAKTLIDAFLAFNPDLKIILGIPTICENSGNGWIANYGQNIYSQDLYILNMHKYWTAFINTFANGNYNPRVDCSYEAIYLDRNNGYPKINGIHSNAIHPDRSGCDQLAKGIVLAINKLLNNN